MLPESRRASPDIDSNIQNHPLNHAHQLALRMTDLIVQPSQHVLCRARVIILHEVHLPSNKLGKLAPVETFKKEATIIAKHFGLNDQQVWNGGLNSFHGLNRFHPKTH